jgi:aminopeptidase N
MMSLAIGELKKFVEGDEQAERQLRALAGNLARAQFEKLGWNATESEDETITKLRTTIIGLMVYSQDEQVLADAKKLYSENTLEQLDPELRPLIISSVVRYSHTSELIDTLIQAYTTTQLSELQQDIASGLTATKDTATIEKLLSLITDDSTIRHQDVARWFVWLIRNRDGRTLAWNWVRDNWKWIETTFGSDKSYDDFPRYAAGALITRDQLEEYKTFFTPLKNEPALARVIAIGIGEIEGRVELIERDSEAVRQALAKL